MPISSGALGWPESYFRKPEEEEDSLTRNSFNSTEGEGQSVWTVQLADRDQYERWKQTRDKTAAKTKKKTKRNKIKEEKRVKSEIKRNAVSYVLRRRRRRQLCLLVSMVTIVSTAILIGSIYLYTHYLEIDDLGPPVFSEAECEGKWRTHFLAYKSVLPNGTVQFSCCYMPDVNATAWYYVIQRGDVWPDGYLITKQDCVLTSPNCKDFEKPSSVKTFNPGTPPCAAHATKESLLLILFCSIVLIYPLSGPW